MCLLILRLLKAYQKSIFWMRQASSLLSVVQVLAPWFSPSSSSETIQYYAWILMHQSYIHTSWPHSFKLEQTRLQSAGSRSIAYIAPSLVLLRRRVVISERWYPNNFTGHLETKNRQSTNQIWPCSTTVICRKSSTCTRNAFFPTSYCKAWTILCSAKTDTVWNCCCILYAAILCVKFFC